MKLKSINYVNFRNLADGKIEFNSMINLFIGKNGHGKTSILETIYFIITGRSFRTSKIIDLVKYNQDKCGAFLEYEDTTGEKNLSIKFNDKKKNFYYNGKKVSHNDYYGKVSVVSFIPEDIKIITGSPSARREFFDEEISQSDLEYFNLLREYLKVIKIRNYYLKQRQYNDEISNIYDEKFIDLMAKIILKRVDYIKKINIILNLNYRKLFDITKELGISYIPQINIEKKDNIETLKEKIKKEILKIKKDEVRYGYTLIGPQKDEFKFLLNGKDAKHYSSQGEKKSILFSLKLSEIDMIFREKKENPIFIIDDISSYFDKGRKNSILKYLEGKKIQLFISSTEKIDIECKEYKIQSGVVI